MEDNTNKKNNCPEESSSWTFYIQGFMYENDDDDCMVSDDQLEESPSLVSDAASALVKLNNNGYNSSNICRLMSPIDDEMNFDECKNNLGFCSGKSDQDHHLIPRRSMRRQNSSSLMNCKKLKNKVVTPSSVENYDLEDTASSPVNSPKIVRMNQFMGHKQKGKRDDHRPEVKRNIFGKGGELGVQKDTTNYINMKKRTCG